MTTPESVYEFIRTLPLSSLIEYLFEDCHDNHPLKNLRTFQKLILDIANTRKETFVASTSQSGKTTTALAYTCPILFKPNGLAMFVTNRKDNADEFMTRFILHILGDPSVLKELAKEKVKPNRGGIDCLPLLKIGSKTNLEKIQIAATGVTVTSQVASINAISGKSPDILVLDEMAAYPAKVQEAIWAEAQTRTGNSEGLILALSTVRNEGSLSILPTGNVLVNGNLFYAYLDYYKKLQGKVPHVAALDFTYHASEKLLKEVPLKIMSAEKEKHHYWSIPMTSDAEPLFSGFDQKKHVFQPEAWDEIEHRNTDTWCLSIDPGSVTAAAVLIQGVKKDPQILKVHKAWSLGKEETMHEFTVRVWRETTMLLGSQIRKLMVTADIASRQHLGNERSTAHQLIEHVTGQPCYTRKISVQESTHLLKTYIDYYNPLYATFQVSASESDLISAILTAKPQVDDNGVPIMAYVKDGIRDHKLDALRYGTYNMTYGVSPYKTQAVMKIREIRTAYD